MILAEVFLTVLELYFEYRPLKPPQFAVLSAPIGVVDPSSGAIALVKIPSRRMRVLRVENPNSTPICAQFNMQFPEAILSVTPAEFVDSFPCWEGLPKVDANGSPETNLILEPFATNELTGLRSFNLKKIPCLSGWLTKTHHAGESAAARRTKSSTGSGRLASNRIGMKNSSKKIFRYIILYSGWS
jgi:hypothetical protein